jgi:anti-sigma regulatory factor (Ser/Thr protein kinase)
VARRFVAGVLHSWRMSEMVDGDIELCASELVTNALRHAESSVTVIVRYDGSVVRVEVGDGSRALPHRPVTEDGATSGRGIMIVEALCASWGVTATVEGKRVWMEMPAARNGAH